MGLTVCGGTICKPSLGTTPSRKRRWTRAYPNLRKDYILRPAGASMRGTCYATRTAPMISKAVLVVILILYKFILERIGCTAAVHRSAVDKKIAEASLFLNTTQFRYVAATGK